MDTPDPNSDFLREHAERLISSYRRVTGRSLIARPSPGETPAGVLFNAPYGVVSHGTEEDPVFNYGNRMALRLFEISWADFVALPSCHSAEPTNRAERQSLLARVSEYGYVDDYSGIRISSTGRRFRIEEATVWNIMDERGAYRGQAAVFFRWSAL